MRTLPGRARLRTGGPVTGGGTTGATGGKPGTRVGLRLARVCHVVKVVGGSKMTQPPVPDSPAWERHWTIDAGSVTLQRVTRRIAHAVLNGGPITSTFEEGALHDRIPQAMGVVIRDIDSGAAAYCRPPGSSSAVPTDGSSAISGPTARPAARAASRSATPSPHPHEARASALQRWPRWSGASQQCRGSAGLPRSRVPRTPLPGACSNAGDSTSRARHRAPARCATH